MTRGII